jgi:glucosyl-3-phosphoglycerate phosphatase
VTRLLLLRHGESEWNAQGRWQGWADPPLSELGRRQAEEAGRRLRHEGFTAFASSDLVRARRTAELAASTMGLEGGVHIDADLREFDIGDWSGLTRAQIEEGWPDEFADWRAGRRDTAPGGEARATFVARLVAAVGRVAATFPDQSVLVISHGGAIGSLERFLGVKPDRPAHLGGRWIDASPEALHAGAPLIVFPAGAGFPDQQQTSTLGEATEFSE